MRKQIYFWPSNATKNLLILCSDHGAGGGTPSRRKQPEVSRGKQPHIYNFTQTYTQILTRNVTRLNTFIQKQFYNGRADGRTRQSYL